MKIRSTRHYLGYVFGGLWLLGIICLASLVASLVSDFRRGVVKDDPVAITQPANGRLIVTVSEPPVRYTGDIWFIDNDEGWDLTEDSMKLTDIKVRVIKSEDSTYSITLQRFGRGRNSTMALSRAGKVQYNVLSRDSVLELGSGFAIHRDNKYRGQRVLVEIRVPVGKKIYFDESITEKLNPIDVRVKEKFRERRYRRDIDFEWDDDRYFDWQAGVDYVMIASGRLERAGLNINTQDVSTDAKEDSLKKVIEERQRQLEEDRKKLEQIRQRKDTQSTTLKQKEQKRSIPIAIPFVPTII